MGIYRELLRDDYRFGVNLYRVDGLSEGGNRAMKEEERLVAEGAALVAVGCLNAVLLMLLLWLAVGAGVVVWVLAT